MSGDKIEKMVFEWGRQTGFEACKINLKVKPIRSVSECEELFPAWEEGIIQDADFANVTLPKIRELAGCKDSGPGTFTDCTEEQLERADELVDKFFEGASEGWREACEKFPKFLS